MAIRTKTVEYAFDLVLVGGASGAITTFTNQANLDIPETSSRVFKSAILEVGFLDNAAAAASMTNVVIGMGFGSTNMANQWCQGTLTNTGENQSFYTRANFTGYWQANYSGTTQTGRCNVVATGFAINNVTAKWIITYEFDDASQNTRLKTVKIPLEGWNGNLTTGLANVNGAATHFQVPNLDAFLPESGKLYKDIFFEAWVNESVSVATAANPQLGLALDAEATSDDAGHEDALASGRLYKRIWRRTDMTTSAAHDFKAKTTTTNMPMTCLAPILTVTYSYEHDNTTAAINSVQIPFAETPYAIGGPDFRRSVVDVDFWINEPGPIDLRQSAAFVTFSERDAVTLDFRTGLQTTRNFVWASIVRCGSLALIRRFDANAIGGAGVSSLSRGKNTFNVNWTRNTNVFATMGTGLSGLIYLNYSSGVASGGVDSHNKTVQWTCMANTGVGQLAGLIQCAAANTGTSIPIPASSNYFLQSVGFQVHQRAAGITASQNYYDIGTEIRPGEYASGLGWRNVVSKSVLIDGEMNEHLEFDDATRLFKPYQEYDMTDKLDPRNDRQYRMFCNWGVSYPSVTGYATYHQITYPVTGILTGYAGNGDNVIVKVHSNTVSGGATTGYLYSMNSNASAGYVGIWYDNTVPLYCEAFQDSTHLGRSNSTLAGG